jgi:coenzyme F420 hydrogenase subunit beta
LEKYLSQGASMLSPKQRVEQIVEHGLCIGCGLCQSVAGEDKIQVLKGNTGFLVPIVSDTMDAATADQIYATCPGVRVQGLPDNLIATDTKVDNVWGPWQRMVRAWAGDAEQRHIGATAGVLTALACHLLQTKQVDFILHTKTHTSEPSFGEMHISRTPAEVLQGSGSRYGPTAPLISINKVLDMGQAFAFIGKPCDVAGLRNYAEQDARVDALVKFTLAPVCGGWGPPASTENFYRRMGVEPEQVTGLRYRGHGCPGPTQITTKDTVIEAHYLDFWGDDASMWDMPFRCKVCPDGIGEAADIAAADTWILGSPTREESATDLGTNAIIARSQAGAQLLAQAAQAGALTIEQDITPDDMSVYQPHQMRKKYAVAPRYQGLKDAGQLAVRTQRLRVDELAAELPFEVNERQRLGTIERVAKGKATQPTPALTQRKG